MANLLAGVPLAWADYKLGPNDVVHVSVFGYEDMTGDLRVSESGELPFPLLGEVKIGGLTTTDAEKKIAELLSSQGYLRNPQVSVMVREYHSQEVSVLGFVNKPGRYSLDRENTVADLIALAGGVNEQGDDRAIISRVNDGRSQQKEVDLKGLLEKGDAVADIPAQSGDVIFVPRAPIFYIYGEVQKPGAYRLERGMTVAQSLSLGGGLTARGSQNSIVIQRKINGKNQEVDVELNDSIQRDDVVYVGERWF